MSRFGVTALAAAALLAGGCGSYKLQGRVVEGDYTGVEIVGRDDERLSGRGVSGVMLRLMTDPTRPNRRVVGETVSNGTGDFAMPVDVMGAGFLEIDAGLTTHKRGYETADGFFRLPGSGRRVLVTVRPGSPREDDPFRSEDVDEMLRRFR